MKKSIIALTSVLLGFVLLLTVPKPDLIAQVPFSKARYDSRHHLVSLSLTPDHKYRLFTPLERISPLVIKATLIKEDRYFHHHPGTNPISLIKGAWRTYIIQDRRVGGSTITMQLAKVRYRIHSRRIPGKIKQILKAIQIELHYNKRQILEAYFNLIAYGGNLEGVGTASWRYFKKPVSKVNLFEAATLSVIPQHPARLAPGSGYPGALKEARDRLLKQLKEAHPELFVL